MAINCWNSLDSSIKNVETLRNFKQNFKNIDKPKHNKLFYFGSRIFSIYHARLRMGCSSLNSHLSIIMHIKDNPKCNCGSAVESPSN